VFIKMIIIILEDYRKMRIEKGVIQCPSCRALLSVDTISAKLFDDDVKKYMKDERSLMR
jgi:ethanolamine utilization cobalamin adenosyltransferase